MRLNYDCASRVGMQYWQNIYIFLKILYVYIFAISSLIKFRSIGDLDFTVTHNGTYIET